MHRFALLCAGLLTLSSAGPQAKPQGDAAARRQEASAMFAEARSALDKLPAEYAPEYLDYLAHQEELAGESGPAGGDLQAAFAAALAVPGGSVLAIATKREVEMDVVTTFLANGDLASATALAEKADAGQALILDAVIPACIAGHQDDTAKALWAAYRPTPLEFAFPAAAAMASSTDLSAADRRGVMTTADEVAAKPANMAEAEQAIDYLEIAATLQPLDPGVEPATRSLAANVQAFPGAPWEDTAILGRAAALVKTLDSTRPLAKPTVAGPFTRASPTVEPERVPPARPVPFAPAQAPAMFAAYSSMSEQFWPKGTTMAERIPPAMIGAPSWLIRFAYNAYVAGNIADEQGALTVALRLAGNEGAQTRELGAANFNGAALWVYGLAAQLDFEQTRAASEALPQGWLKPLALAHVARMAVVSVGNRPGKRFQIWR